MVAKLFKNLYAFFKFHFDVLLGYFVWWFFKGRWESGEFGDQSSSGDGPSSGWHHAAYDRYGIGSAWPIMAGITISEVFPAMDRSTTTEVIPAAKSAVPGLSRSRRTCSKRPPFLYLIISTAQG
jgi:hypothetical protein